MTTLYIPGALLLWIVGFEAYRRWKREPFSMLSMTHLIFALGYALPPFIIFFVMGTSYETGPYFGKTLFVFQFYRQLSFSDTIYQASSLRAVLAYAVMLLSFLAVSRMSIWSQPRRFDRVQLSRLVWGGVILGVLSIIAWNIYASQFGSFEKMLSIGPVIRARHAVARWGFLQFLTLLGVPAFIFLAVAGLKSSGKIRTGLWVFAAIVWGVVALRTYHSAGRLSLFTFLALIPLGAVLHMGFRNRWAVGIFGGLILVALLIIGSSHLLFANAASGIEQTLSSVFSQTGKSIFFILNEFTFPYLVSARTPTIAPDIIAYRYFIDLPLTVLYMLPSLSGADSWPPMLSVLHQATLQGFKSQAVQRMPIDLVSFGYYNLGNVGVGITFVVFGGLLGALEKWLAPGTGLLAQFFRAGWMLYIPFWLMYADPYTTLKAGFGLLVGTFVVFMMTWFVRRGEKKVCIENT